VPDQAVTQRSVTVRLPVPGAPRFTGRDRELAALAATLAGPPAVVIVEGEAGIGKTRLIGEYLATPQGTAHKAVVATCPAFRQPHTLGPVTDALRQGAPADAVGGLGLSALAGALRPLFPEWSDDLPAPPEPAEDASAARHRVFAALAELLRRLQVGLLVVEDVHWADEATLEFLLYLAACEPRQAGLVVSFRPEDVAGTSLVPRLSRLAAGDTGTRISLGPLDVPGTAALMSSMLAGAGISEEFAAFMHEPTGGVPLAVEESVRAMAARGDLCLRGGEWVRRSMTAIIVPPTVRDTVLGRARRLGADAQAVLHAAAILAGPADESAVGAVAGLPVGRARAGLCEGLTCGLLEEDSRGVVSFRHVLAARAVYEAILGPDRRAMHLRAGMTLEDHSPLPVAQLALHFREAGDIGKWCRYAESTADLALAAGDEVSAGALLCDLMVNAALPPGEVARLADKIVLWTLDIESRLRDLAQALRQLIGTGNLARREEAELRFHLGRVFGVMENYEASRAEFERALPWLPTGSRQAYQAVRLLGLPMGTAYPAAKYLRWLRRAARILPPDPVERLCLALDRTTALLILGHQEGWTAAAAIPDQPSGPRERVLVTIGHGNVGEAGWLWGRYGEARRRLGQAVELADRFGYPQLRASAQAVLVHLDWCTGAWGRLADCAAELAGQEDLDVVARIRVLLVGALLHGVGGMRGEAQARLQQALSEVRRHSAVDYLAEPSAALARLALADGNPGAALDVTEEPIRIVSRKGTWVWAAELAPARAEALVQAGKAGEATELVAAFSSGLRGRDAPAPKAGLALCRAILAEARGEHVRAAALFSRAAAAWRALPRPYDALLARERQACCLLAAGRRDAALPLLNEVLTGMSRLGATWDAARVARRLREHGARIHRPGAGRPGYGNQLSPREQEVVRLLAAGRASKDIAAELFLSPKTVARHLGSAMRKLGTATPAALAVRAMQVGAIPSSRGDGPTGPTAG
jgi:DNA-binding NarL/FixJ family response regulator